MIGINSSVIGTQRKQYLKIPNNGGFYRCPIQRDVNNVSTLMGAWFCVVAINALMRFIRKKVPVFCVTLARYCHTIFNAFNSLRFICESFSTIRRVDTIHS